MERSWPHGLPWACNAFRQASLPPHFKYLGLDRRSLLALTAAAIGLVAVSSDRPIKQDLGGELVQRARAAASTGTIIVGTVGSVEYMRTVIDGPDRPLNPVIEVWHKVGAEDTRIEYPSQSAKVMTTGEIISNGRLITYDQVANRVVVTGVHSLSRQERAHWLTGSTIQELRDQLQNGDWRRVGTVIVDGRPTNRVEKRMSFEMTDPQHPGHLVNREGLVIMYLSEASGLPIMEERFDATGPTPILRQRMRLEYRVIPPGQAPAPIFDLPGMAKTAK